MLKCGPVRRCAVSMVLLLIGVVPWSGASAASSPSLGPVSVNVKAAKIRTEPKAWAAAVSAVKYGDSIEALSSADGWLKVKTAAGKQGYLHQSAVTTKKIVLSARGGAGDAATERADVVLAGKGFNKDVERDLAAQDAALNFKAVDAMEKVRVSDAELAAFLKTGQLGKRG